MPQRHAPSSARSPKPSDSEDVASQNNTYTNAQQPQPTPNPCAPLTAPGLIPKTHYEHKKLGKRVR